MSIFYEFRRINGPDVVNLTTDPDPHNASLVTFSNGTGAVFYENSSSLIGRLLDSRGEPKGGEIQLASAESFNQGDQSYGATALSNGRIAVSWIKDGNVVAQIYDANLKPIGGQILALDSSNDFTESKVVATANGGFVVSATLSWALDDRDIYLKTFNAAGTAMNSASYTPGGTLDSEPVVGVLPNGNIAVAWIRYSNYNEVNSSIWTALYSPTLATIREPAEFPDSSGTFTRSPQIDVRRDGSYLLTYEKSINDTIERYVIGADGTATPFSSPSGSGSGAAISSGGHTVLLTSYGSNDGNNDVYAILTLPGSDSYTTYTNITNTSGYKYDATPTWINPYTMEVIYYRDPDGISLDTEYAARYLVVRTNTGTDSPQAMTGDALLDVMIGKGGNDTMDGAGGPDTMQGGAGSDTYYVDNAGDVVDEGAAGSDGYDTVRSYINYTLGNNVEGLALLGSVYSGTGNALNNTLQGNAAANRLDGSFGADNMKGLGGNDVYVVDNAGDVVNEIEPGSSGWDTVYSLIDYKLGTNLEGLVLVGTLKLDGTGNGAANSITGNIAANGLKGGGGNDSISGLGGKDKIDGGGGSDTAYYNDKTQAISVALNGSHLVSVKVGGKVEDSIKNVENLIGSIKADHFTGDNQANSFNGGLGKDVFKGGGGNDTFVFSTALGAANADTITDFTHKHDTLVLSRGLVNAFLGSAVDKGEFFAKAGAHKAHDNDDRLIYDKSNGHLYLDVDGKDGAAAAVLIAKLSNHPGDFNFHDISIV